MMNIKNNIHSFFYAIVCDLLHPVQPGCADLKFSRKKTVDMTLLRMQATSDRQFIVRHIFYYPFPGSCFPEDQISFVAALSCPSAFSIRFSSGRTIQSIVTKQAVPPIVLEIGSAMNTPSVPIFSR